ncbi:MAG: TRAM domain-containing protein [Bacillota bacterium]|nr:TRAM domain-containing protein [Bacillota bacterium]
MLNRVIKISFAAVGAATGFTIVKTLLSIYNPVMNGNVKVVLYVVATAFTGVIFYSTGNVLIQLVLNGVDKFEQTIQKLTLYELGMAAVGLIVGLIIANLVAIPIDKIDVVGVPVSIIVNVLFGCIGIAVAIRKKNDIIPDFFKLKSGVHGSNKNAGGPILLDTSIIIDGRILDVCRSRFLEGELIVPSFVLEELRHIADSADVLKRNRGRRGLDVLNILQKELNYPVKIETMENVEGTEVDDKLLVTAKRLGGKIFTTDYNLSKVASFQGVTVLNINELANSLKPIALPGEDMLVQVIKDGKENGQGIAYLDDGTMIVVDGGRRYIGEEINVTVTSVLQTAAGRMIFAKPKLQIERII